MELLLVYMLVFFFWGGEGDVSVPWAFNFRDLMNSGSWLIVMIVG